MAARRGLAQFNAAMQKILQGLNAAQKAAVTSAAPVLQVLAPPGSGKTKTLTSRVAYLLAHEQYAPWNVICCTFTIKASREMRERLRGMIGEELESKLVLGTFHSVCRRYLVTYGHLIGIPKTFGVADSDDSLTIIKRIIKRLGLGIDPRVARSRISHRKARGQRVQDIPKATLKHVEAQEFATIFQQYEDALALSNLLDYDDLLMRCVDLLREHPGCVSNIEALLIDEFQDTNVIQFELMKLLAAARRRVTIVGDPDQSIYGFRSAEIENLIRMRRFYPETVVINLEENYRSASAVLDLAQEVIEQDESRPQKKLKSTHCYGCLPVLRRLPNPHEEAQWIVSEIKRVTSMTGDLLEYSDVAILLRSAFLSLLIEKALANAGIPYRMVGGRRFFDRVEVRLLLDYLRTISHPDNSSALAAIINTPTRKLGETTVKEFMKMAEQRKQSLWSTLKQIVGGQISMTKKLSRPAEQGLRELVSLIESGQRELETMQPQDAPGKLIELVVKKLDFQNFLKRQYPEDHEERWENVRELLHQATDASLDFNAPDNELPTIEGMVQESPNGPEEVLARFLANVALSTEVESDKEGERSSRITISTIHSAKGLEWPVVFIPAVYEGSIPHSRAENTDEERRLLYVAMTRAQALLYMTFPVMQSRDASESILSQFLSPKINPMVSQTGAIFSDGLVNDMASVLRRASPSQESIAKGHLSIKENESQFDDIWPKDGSHKRAFAITEGEVASFSLKNGQSPADALKGSHSYRQQSSYSTLAHYPQSMRYPSKDVAGDSASAASNLSLAFTTANHHLQTHPTPICAHTTQPTLKKSISDLGVPVAKKPKLDKSSSGQGNIAAFFGGSGAKIGGASALGGRSSSGAQRFEEGQSSKVQAEAVDSDMIPSALSKHRLAYGSRSLHSSGRTALNSVQANDINGPRKRGHGFLTTSPNRDKSGCEHMAASVSTTSSITDADKSLLDVCADTTSAASRIKSQANVALTIPNIGARSLTMTTTTTMSKNSFGNSNLRRLGTLNPLNNMSGPIGLGGTSSSSSGRTLGVRRSMNGWENRKNK